MSNSKAFDDAVHLSHRPRRLRRSASLRALVKEHELKHDDLIQPVFVKADGPPEEVPSMPGIYRYNPDDLLDDIKKIHSLGIGAIAIFPALSNDLKDTMATESTNPHGLLPSTVQRIKKELPQMLVITDVAMDPYSSDGHDGLLKDGLILNDPTLTILAEMAVTQAIAGADMIAPSDMMDGRIGFIRQHLDQAGFQDVAILAYSAKYCSAFYGPFRDALDSAPRGGDKKTYQMDPANSREALREIQLDIQEGADIVMIKPGLPYLDIIRQARDRFDTPIAAYNVSGEYAMVKAASAQGWIDEKAIVLESLLAFKRAGADMILTYHAADAAKWI